MNAQQLRDLLSKLEAGESDVDTVLARLRRLPYENLGYARLDTHRELRQGLPEVVFGANKTTEQMIGILQQLWESSERVLATRVEPGAATAIKQRLPAAHYDPISRLLWLDRSARTQPAADAPYAMVVSGGTSDLPVAEEAAQVAQFFGTRVERAYDVGVAGLHRLLDQVERLQAAEVVISVAGMEGALTSAVAGLVGCPVVGVPTSVGYGASFGGLAALLAMLSSCAPGVTVVNIDNGFGAGVYAYRIISRLEEARHS